ncbi:hypothetical protein RP20_CCG000246 [Aedes albopictus]|nr:hypothetical protein RP20_CCG000246 [Aedes albopictus]
MIECLRSLSYKLLLGQSYSSCCVATSMPKNRRLVKLTRDLSFLLGRPLQYKKVDLTSSETKVTKSFLQNRINPNRELERQGRRLRLPEIFRSGRNPPQKRNFTSICNTRRRLWSNCRPNHSISSS